MTNTITLFWEDVTEGDKLPTESFPLTAYRLAMAASGTQDFNSIHHNSAYAKASGAPEMYANNFFLQGMWEKTVRQYVGPSGVIKSLRNFRMISFNTIGQTVTVKGKVKRKWHDEHNYVIEIELRTENEKGETTVGPGTMQVVLPTKRKD